MTPIGVLARAAFWRARAVATARAAAGAVGALAREYADGAARCKANARAVLAEVRAMASTLDALVLAEEWAACDELLNFTEIGRKSTGGQAAWT